PPSMFSQDLSSLLASEQSPSLPAFLAAGEAEPARIEAEAPDAGTAAEPFTALASRQSRRPGMRGGLFIMLVLVPLISYSVLATIAVIILYLRPVPPHPLEMLPDEGDRKGAKRE